MSKRRFALFLGIAIIAFLASLLLMTPGNTKAGSGGTRAAGDYVGDPSLNCAGCHDKQFTGWNTTNHAHVFDSNAPFFNGWVAAGKPQYCLPCHTVGYNKTAINGYDPTQAYNSTRNQGLLGIQCENCHGPDPMNNASRSNTFMQTDPKICYQCHNGDRNPQYTEWQTSAHAKPTPSFARNLACSKCHEAKLAGDYLSTGQDPTALPANPRWQLTCSSCHSPHNGTYGAQLRRPAEEICVACHNADNAQPGQADVHHPEMEMRQGTANVPVPSSQTMSAVYCAQCHMHSYDYNSTKTPKQLSGHEFKPKPEACVACHDGTGGFNMNLNQATYTIDNWQASTQNNLDNVRPVLNQAFGAIHDASNFGFDQNTINLARSKYEQANYSANFVDQDGSMGAHNFQYANSLLSFSNSRANDVIFMLTPGRVSGKVVDSSGNGVSGVQIQIGGTTWATTASDGSFTIAHAPGGFILNLVKDGSDVGSASVSIVAGGMSDAGKIKIGEGGASNTYQLATLVLVVIALILLVIMMISQRKKPAVPEQKSVPPPPESEKN